MKISDRLSQVQPSLTLEVNAKANQLREEGIDIVNFGVGEPDFDTPLHIREAGMNAIKEGFTRYTSVDGILELKQAILKKFEKDNGLSYKLNQISVNPGGKFSSYLVFQTILNFKDEVIVPSPYWVSYPPMIILAGGIPIIVPTRERDSFKLQPSDLKELITAKTKALILNSPSNPTGSVYSRDELKSLTEICVKNDILIISDEIYESIVFDNIEFCSVASLSKKVFENTITLNGVSKTYAMTGWRIGYMAGPKDIIKGCVKIQSQSTSNPCSISQKAAIAALNGPQDGIKDLCNIFLKRRDYVLNRLLKIPGVTCILPQGAFYVMPNFSSYFGKKYKDFIINGSVDLSRFLLEEGYVATVAGAAFGEDSCIRLSFATSDERIKEGLNRIEKVLLKLT